MPKVTEAAFADAAPAQPVLHSASQTQKTMLAKALSAAVCGIDANLIDVEVDFSGVKLVEDRFYMVGLPDSAVRESRERVRAAIKNSGFQIPPTSITVNLAPADIKKKARASISRLPSPSCMPRARCNSKICTRCSSSASWGSTAYCGPCPACCPSQSSRANAASVD